MNDSMKAKLMADLLIALIAYGISSVFGNLTIHEDHDSYKMMPVKETSFVPVDVIEVPTIIPKVQNTTKNTTKNTTYKKTNSTWTTYTYNSTYNQYRRYW